MAEVLDGRRPPATVEESSALAITRMLAPSIHPSEEARREAKRRMLAEFDQQFPVTHPAPTSNLPMSVTTVQSDGLSVVMADIEVIGAERAAAAAQAVQEIADSLRAGQDL